MEKRLILAFLLSFFVLSAWSALNPPPKKINPTQSQVTINKEDTNYLSKKDETISLSTQSKESVAEEIVVLENDKIKVEFSNIGGSLKKVIIKEFNISLPITKIYSLKKYNDSEFVVQNNTPNKITYVFKNGDIKIIKNYVLSKDDYLIHTDVQTEGLSNLEISGYTVDASNIERKIFQSPEKSLHEYSIGLASHQVIRKDNAIEFNLKENKNEIGEVAWIGYRDRYFCLVIKPKFKTANYSILTNDKSKLAINLAPADGSLNNYSAVIYSGPQKLHLLSSYNQDFENIMVFSNWPILDFFAKVIYYFVHFLQSILRNWGAAILVLGLTIYAVTYPLTAKSMSSMRKMQALQPKMKSLQERYKSDPQKLNKEMMELYKENKVNPFGGCLPMILQMPIFYGLYQVLWCSVDFKGAHFLWIKDLSLPDRLAILPFNFPFLGNEFNILPLIMATSMFFQQKFTSRNMVITDDTQKMQQKMMSIMMPIMMGVIFYHFAAGLCLYFTVFYLLSTLTQWKMSKINVVN